MGGAAVPIIGGLLGLFAVNKMVKSLKAMAAPQPMPEFRMPEMPSFQMPSFQMPSFQMPAMPPMPSLPPLPTISIPTPAPVPEAPKMENAQTAQQMTEMQKAEVEERGRIAAQFGRAATILAKIDDTDEESIEPLTRARQQLLED